MVNKRSTFQQVRILISKNFKLFGRSPSSIATMIFIPLLIVCSLFFFSWLIENTKSQCIELDTEEYKNLNLPKCEIPNNCKSVVYFILEQESPDEGLEDPENERILEAVDKKDNDSELNAKDLNRDQSQNKFLEVLKKMTSNETLFSKRKTKEEVESKESSVLEESFKPKKIDKIRKIMNILAVNNSLEMENDVKEVRVHSSQEISDYTNSHRNETQIAYIFCNSKWDINFNQMNLDIPCSFDNMLDQEMLFYSVHYNVTHGVENPFMFKLSSAYPLNHLLVSAKKELDKAIVQYETGQDFEFDFNTKGFPTTTCMRFEGYDFISSFGSFFLYLPSAVSFFLFN